MICGKYQHEVNGSGTLTIVIDSVLLVVLNDQLVQSVQTFISLCLSWKLQECLYNIGFVVDI